MQNKNDLRPVLVIHKGKSLKGFFHRFVYKLANYHSETHVLVELEDGKLRYFEPYYVQFSDRSKSRKKSNEELKNSTETNHNKLSPDPLDSD